jgi:uncharacterized protein (TIGR00730 family)
MELCLFGAASDAVPQVYITEIESLGEALAARGHSLLFGGGSTGMMGAAARGVHRLGGRIVGVAPSFFDRPGVLSELCDERIITQTMDERKAILEERADAFIVAPGGIGTLDEFFEVLTLKQLGRHQKPIIIYNVRGYYTPLLELMEQSIREHF